MGATWLDEPGIPAPWNDAAYTGDYGRTGFYRHSPTRNGATVTISNEKFVTMSNPIEMDVDGNSAIYLTSWNNGGFTYTGPDKGYIARVVPKGYQPEPLPDFDKLSNSGLVKLLESPSQKRRLEAQSVLLRLSGAEAEVTPLLQTLASDTTKRLH